MIINRLILVITSTLREMNHYCNPQTINC